MARKIGELLLDIDTQLGKLKEQLAAGNTAVGKYAKKQKSILGKLKAGWLAVAAGAYLLVRGIGKAIKTSVEFQQAIDNVRSVSGGTRKELSKLAREAGKTTVFSAKKAADAMYFLASAGLEVKDMARVLTPTLNLAAAAQIDIARATDIVVNNLKVFGKGMEEAESITDIMAKTVSSSNTNMEQLADALGYAGPVAATANISFEDLNATLATMANRGLKGGQAGSQLRMALARLTKPSKEAEDALAKYGITTEEITKLIPTPIKLFQRLHDANLSNADALAILGVRQTGVTALIKDGIGDLHNMKDALDDSAGAAKNMADIQIDNVAGALKLLHSRWQEFILMITTGSLPALKKFILRLGEIVGKVTELIALTDMTAEVQDRMNKIIKNGADLTEEQKDAIVELGRAESILAENRQELKDRYDALLKKKKEGIEITKEETNSFIRYNSAMEGYIEKVALLRNKLGNMNVTSEEAIRIFKEWQDGIDVVIEKEDEKTEAIVENNAIETESNNLKIETNKGNIEDYYSFLQNQRELNLIKEQEAYEAAKLGLQKALAEGKVAQENAKTELLMIEKRHAQNVKKINNETGEFVKKGISQAIGSSVSSFAGGLAEMIVEGDAFKKSFSEIFKDLIKMAAKLIIQLLIIKGIKMAFGGLGIFFKKGGQVPKTIYAANGAEVRPMRPKGTDTIPAMLTPKERVLTVDDNKLLGQFINRFSDIYGQARPSGLSQGTDTGGAGPDTFNVENLIIENPVSSPEDIVGLTKQELAEKQTNSRGLRR